MEIGWRQTRGTTLTIMNWISSSEKNALTRFNLVILRRSRFRPFLSADVTDDGRYRLIAAFAEKHPLGNRLVLPINE